MSSTQTPLGFNPQVISDTVASVLETMVFAFCEPAETTAKFQSDEFLIARIRYGGSRNGELSLVAAMPLCREWAETMAGDNSASQIFDALSEVANTIGGNWLTKAFASDEDIKLQPPASSIATQEDWDAIVGAPTTVLLSVDGFPVVLHINALD